jgi:hypothetical protein
MNRNTPNEAAENRTPTIEPVTLLTKLSCTNGNITLKILVFKYMMHTPESVTFLLCAYTVPKLFILLNFKD